jgi:hypothetical protein
MSRKKTDKEITLPFGKHRGRNLASVLQEEPSYLCWFMEKVEGCRDIKEAIAELPGFREHWTSYQERKHRTELTTRQIVEETVSRMLGVGQPPSPEQLDDLCDRLFNNPPPDAS